MLTKTNKMKEIEKMGKKGMFYTLGLSLFALILLLLAVLFFRHAQSVESRNVELSFAQKYYDLDVSIQNIFTEAFLSKSTIDLTSNSNSLTIEESFPFDFTELDNLVNDLKSKVENDFSAIDISQNDFSSYHSLTLMPLNITYRHSGNNRIIIPANSDITAYNITLTFTENITSCTPNIVGGGTVDLYFYAQSPGNDCQVSQSNVDEGDIGLTVGGEEVSIHLESDGEFIIESNATAQSIVTVNFYQTNQRTYFQLPITLEIDDPVLSFYKRSMIKFPISS
ncbi:MAG: hypothetical protein ABH824_02615 [Nanoarchaeota archaeon]|nr:hypothetical protein [Nanoarchaeota archaeon]MBU1632125.1 hypothetical protein [Nanoarchaeota archaeon]MBU1876190.1 hypothetical protein [Nanoarchaeota archaeon]